ncbi:MAG TPA: ribosome maturation factor RimM [Casimicrobiaceae bacterium]|nr:ribosome maturation factor RimM [Casimicrobiaceae bacterium]
MKPLVVMARVVAPYGVRGWIKVAPFTESPDALLAYRTWWMTDREEGKLVPRDIVDARTHSDHLVAKLVGIDTREDAARFRGSEVSVPRDALPEPQDNEVYLADLVGCEVVTTGGERLGEVVDVQDAGSHPILRVADESGERMIPFVDAYVVSVDLEASRVEVRWERDFG